MRDPCAERPLIEALSPSRGLATLLSHISADFLLSPTELRREVDALTRLAGQVPVRTVRRGDDIAQLAATCQAISEDVQTLDSSPASVGA